MGPKVGPASSGGQMTASAPSSLGTVKPSTGGVSSPSPEEGGQIDIQNVLQDKTTQWKDWLTKPYNAQAFNSHVIGTMFDTQADPQQRAELAKTIDGNPDLKSYYSNLINNYRG